jgi:hypothetical protein
MATGGSWSGRFHSVHARADQKGCIPSIPERPVCSWPGRQARWKRADACFHSAATMGACGVVGITAWITRLGVDRVVAAAGAMAGESGAVRAVVAGTAIDALAGAVGQGWERLFAFMLPACALVCFNQPNRPTGVKRPLRNVHDS